MSVSAEVLRQLHRIHRQLSDLRSRLAQGPKLVQVGDANVKRCEEAVKTAKELHTKARVAADQKQLQLRQREARIADLQGKLNACATNREYQTLKEQIAADQQANLVLEDEILESLEAIDTLQRGIVEAEQQLKMTRHDLENCRHRVTSEQAGLEAELQRVTSELNQVEANLPDGFRAEYQRMTKARGEDALAQVDNNFCGGCHQSLTAQMINELKMDRLVICKNCGCLLYLPE